MAKQLLIDNFTFVPNLVEDNRSTGGKLIARGEFARADLATENNRVYPRQLWERELKTLSRKIQERKVYGELDHPADGRTQLKRASHIITDLHMEGQVMVGEAEILDTVEGRNLKAILEAGGAVGVSSRGFGTTRPNTEGKDVVQDDYRLMTFDFVADPANTTSYPAIHNEDVNKANKTGKETVMAEKVTLEKLRQSDPKLVESLMDDAQREFERQGAKLWAKKIEQAREEAKQEAEANLKQTFAENLKAAMEAAKAEVAKAEHEKLMKDPSIGAARQALEDVKKLLRPFVMPEDVESVVAAKDQEVSSVNAQVAELNLKVAKLTAENAELASLAKEAGYKFHLENVIRGSEYADLIRKTVGDVKAFESIEALDARIGEIADEVKKQQAKTEERNQEVEALRRENAILKEAAEKGLEATKRMAVALYAEERLKFHPKADVARALIEAKQPESKEAVDNILTGLREKPRDPQAIEEARARVRQLVNSNSRDYAPEEPKVTNNALTESTNFNGLGQDLAALRALSGIGNNNEN